MKKGLLLFLAMIFSLQILFASIGFAREMGWQTYEALEQGAVQIKAKKPGISNHILKIDIAFIESNWQRTKIVKKYLPFEINMRVVADAWVDIRTRDAIPANVGLHSIDLFNRYGILRVDSEPKEGATVILDETDIWDKKTNTYKGVLSGEHLVEVVLHGYSADSQKVDVPEGGDVRITFTLKEAEQ